MSDPSQEVMAEIARHGYRAGSDPWTVCECGFYERPDDESLQEVHARHVADVMAEQVRAAYRRGYSDGARDAARAGIGGTIDPAHPVT